jgi:hypothetical protein
MTHVNDQVLKAPARTAAQARPETKKEQAPRRRARRRRLRAAAATEASYLLSLRNAR